jgi:hypothetical protein
VHQIDMLQSANQEILGKIPAPPPKRPAAPTPQDHDQKTAGTNTAPPINIIEILRDAGPSDWPKHNELDRCYQHDRLFDYD